MYPHAAVTAIEARNLGVFFVIPHLVALHLEEAALAWDDEATESMCWECNILNSYRPTHDAESLSMISIIRLLASHRAIGSKSILDLEDDELHWVLRTERSFFDWFEVAANFGDKQLVRDLCVLDPEFVESKALFAACGVGDLDLVKSLLARDGRARGDYFRNIESGEQPIVLYYGGFSPWGWECPSIFSAAQHGHVDVVRYILRWLRDHPDHADPDHDLMAAIACGLMEEALELVQGGDIDLNYPSMNLRNCSDSYLTVACDCADVDMVLMLIKAGASPTKGATNKMGNPLSIPWFGTPLLCAASMKRTYRPWNPLPSPVDDELIRRESIVGHLLAAGANVESLDKFKSSGTDFDEALAFVKRVAEKLVHSAGTADNAVAGAKADPLAARPPLYHNAVIAAPTCITGVSELSSNPGVSAL